MMLHEMLQTFLATAALSLTVLGLCRLKTALKHYGYHGSFR